MQGPPSPKGTLINTTILLKTKIPFFCISEIQDQDRGPSKEEAHGVPRGCSAGRHYERQG